MYIEDRKNTYLFKLPAYALPPTFFELWRINLAPARQALRQSSGTKTKTKIKNQNKEAAFSSFMFLILNAVFRVFCSLQN